VNKKNENVRSLKNRKYFSNDMTRVELLQGRCFSLYNQ